MRRGRVADAELLHVRARVAPGREPGERPLGLGVVVAEREVRAEQQRGGRHGARNRRSPATRPRQVPAVRHAATRARSHERRRIALASILASPPAWTATKASGRRSPRHEVLGAERRVAEVVAVHQAREPRGLAPLVVQHPHVRRRGDRAAGAQQPVVEVDVLGPEERAAGAQPRVESAGRQQDVAPDHHVAAVSRARRMGPAVPDGRRRDVVGADREPAPVDRRRLVDRAEQDVRAIELAQCGRHVGGPRRGDLHVVLEQRDVLRRRERRAVVSARPRSSGARAAPSGRCRPRARRRRRGCGRPRSGRRRGSPRAAGRTRAGCAGTARAAPGARAWG